MGWDVRVLSEVEESVLALDDDSYEQVAAAIDKLEHDGPTLGRPLVDRIEGSRHHNMRELRPGSAGRSEVRILFIFDPERRAVLLVAGDKAGNWKKWYDRNIPVADERYDEWLRAELHPRRPRRGGKCELPGPWTSVASLSIVPGWTPRFGRTDCARCARSKA